MNSNKESGIKCKDARVINCCECYNPLSDKRPVAVMCSCKNPICTICYDKHHVRARNNSWYKEYIGVCDTCIWFDLGQIIIY